MNSSYGCGCKSQSECKVDTNAKIFRSTQRRCIQDQDQNTHSRMGQLQSNLRELNASFNQRLLHAEAMTAHAESDNHRLRNDRNLMKHENERLWSSVNELKSEVKSEKHNAAQLRSKLQSHIRAVERDVLPFCQTFFICQLTPEPSRFETSLAHNRWSKRGVLKDYQFLRSP